MAMSSNGTNTNATNTVEPTRRTGSSAQRGPSTPREEVVVDVVVVGFGAAGAAAAIEAAESGASVIALDRWGRGGASARSGGIVYLGGGTPQQEAAGFDDDSASMAQYLALEQDLPVDDPRLRDFCERSLDHHRWLLDHGVRFPNGFESGKAVVPTGNDVGLYFSGNERHHDPVTPAVPRGHRVAGAGLTGANLVDALHRSARTAGVDVRDRIRAEGLVVEDGRIVGVDAMLVGGGEPETLLDKAAYQLRNIAVAAFQGAPRAMFRALDQRDAAAASPIRIRVRHGVVLATGGFVFDRDMVARFAAPYRDAVPLGTPGCDGSGITMAMDVGAAVQDMDRCGASRFIAPPTALCSGVLVDQDGDRICDESLYAATLSAEMTRRGGRGWLVIDSRIRDEVRRQVRDLPPIHSRGLGELLSGRASHVMFPKVFGPLNLYVNRKSGSTLRELAGRCGIDPLRLEETIERYNEIATGGEPDPLGKRSEYLRAVTTPPFYAVRCHVDGRVFPAPCITLGGLVTDPMTQAVLRADGSAIDGLFAAGRCAAGVVSRSYVSGLSLADCIHTGRSAGRSVGPARGT